MSALTRWFSSLAQGGRACCYRARVRTKSVSCLPQQQLPERLGEMSDTDDLWSRLEALETQANELANAADLDTAWIIWCGILVFCE